MGVGVGVGAGVVGVGVGPASVVGAGPASVAALRRDRARAEGRMVAARRSRRTPPASPTKAPTRTGPVRPSPPAPRIGEWFEEERFPRDLAPEEIRAGLEIHLVSDAREVLELVRS